VPQKGRELLCTQTDREWLVVGTILRVASVDSVEGDMGYRDRDKATSDSPGREQLPLLGGFPGTPLVDILPFWQRLRKRAGVLIALLIFQSCSSFILAHYEALLTRHSVIVFFLTMLVGAGGNAGNQAAVLVIRGLATGEITARNAPGYVLGEAKMAFSISVLMVGAGYVRVILFGYSQLDALAISCSLLAIVFSSVLIGSTLPLMLHRWQLDPAHAGATIQVIMDLMGVCITCLVCSIMLKGEPHSISTPEEDRLVGEYEVLQQ
jgi:cation transporter-like permease